MKQRLYVVLLKERELRQWLIYFLSHTEPSNHCSMKLFTHPFIMLSRHIICAHVSACTFVSAYLWDFRGIWKKVLKVLWCVFRFRNCECVCTWVRVCCLCLHVCKPLCQSSVHTADTNATHPPRSLWLNLTLSTNGGHTLMCEHRSFCPARKADEAFCWAEATKTTPSWFLQDLAASSSSVSLWSYLCFAYKDT